MRKMNDKADLFMGALFIFAIIVLGVAFIVAMDSQAILDNMEEVTIVGEVTDVEVFDDYLLITFNNNTEEVFKVDYPDDTTDLTVNSELIVKLSRTTHDGIILKMDKYWDIDSIVKIPVKG